MRVVNTAIRLYHNIFSSPRLHSLKLQGFIPRYFYPNGRVPICYITAGKNPKHLNAAYVSEWLNLIQVCVGTKYNLFRHLLPFTSTYRPLSKGVVAWDEPPQISHPALLSQCKKTASFILSPSAKFRQTTIQGVGIDIWHIDATEALVLATNTNL